MRDERRGEERGDGGYNMGYRGGPTPRGEQGPSFYYPGSHDGSQPWPNLIFSRMSDSLARSHSRGVQVFSVNIRVRPTCTYPRSRLGRQRCVLRTLAPFDMNVLVAGIVVKNNRDDICLYFYPTTSSVSERASERATKRAT